MSPEAQVLLSGTLTFGVPLVLAARELLVLRKRPRGGWRPNRRPGRQPPPKPQGNSPAVRPLPACLVPVLPPRPQAAPERSRTLEPV